ncbi:hypothetical protein FWF48_04370, partial [Candidatus Saccharibacteria bacterium]|nr:hypothetical protein [Candidatus Saccharibacteria bacterium]
MDRKGWVAEGYPFDLKDGDALDRGRTSRFFTNVAVCMNCDIDPDQLQKWQDHFVYMRVYDDAIDRDASDVSEYIADPVVAGGLAIAEKRKTI